MRVTHAPVRRAERRRAVGRDAKSADTRGEGAERGQAVTDGNVGRQGWRNLCVCVCFFFLGKTLRNTVLNDGENNGILGFKTRFQLLQIV